jgi:multimeric flavodoxin WrbA
MKIVTLMGSPRSKGSTAAVLRMFEDIVSAQHEVSHFDVARLDIMGCRGCLACADTPDEPGCVQDDDGLRILKEIVVADAVVYATPLYMWGIASDLRGLMERHISLVKDYGSPARRSLLKGKRVALLVSSAGPVEENADVVQTVFDRFAEFAEALPVGRYMLHSSTRPDALGERGRALAERMAKEVTA